MPVQTATKKLTKKEQMDAYTQAVLLNQKKWVNSQEIEILYGKSRHYLLKLRQDSSIQLRYTKFPGDKEYLYLREDIETLLDQRMKKLNPTLV